MMLLPLFGALGADIGPTAGNAFCIDSSRAEFC
jgi:hypothetical protein